MVKKFIVPDKPAAAEPAPTPARPARPPRVWNPRALRAARDAGTVAGWALALFALLSLLTYSPDDSWWLSDPDGGGSGGAQNAGGRAGAQLAATLLAVFGWSAFLLCAALLLAWHVLIARIGDARAAWMEKVAGPPGAVDALAWGWTALGVFLLMFSSSALEARRFAGFGELLPFGAGGVAGGFANAAMTYVFGELGGSLLLAAAWMMSWSLAAGVSWPMFFEKTGRVAEAAAAKTAAWTRRQWDLQIGGRARKRRSDEAMEMRRAIEHPREIEVQEPSLEKPRHATRPLFPGAEAAARKPAGAAGPGGGPGGGKAGIGGAVVSRRKRGGGAEGALPSPSLLDPHPGEDEAASAETLEYNARLIEKNLLDFGVEVKVEAAHAGPVITRYDLLPATGVRGSQVANLVRDLARALSVSAIRVLETIPGKNCMGLEIPNTRRRTVYLSELIGSSAYARNAAALPLALGKDAAGHPVVTDLAAMPHLLAAGATGSGKSVCVNAMLLSLLFSASPRRLRLILIDPKMLELASYEGVPHLLAPVVTDMAQAPAALQWCVAEMERRYRKMAETGARGIAPYNKKVEAGQLGDSADGSPHEVLPYVVVVIDELADLMMVVGKKVEQAVSRLAQKARAAGIHLILATQRPSVDVITGLIKANVPCRIAFQVASRVDSRTILDQMGAEALLGMGDMLYLKPGAAQPTRVHGAFVSDGEVGRVVEEVKRAGADQAGAAVDFSDIPVMNGGGAGGGGMGGAAEGGGGENDPLYAEAVDAVLSGGRPSISLVQRKLRVGYNRAARLIEDMEKAGLVSAMDETGARKILVPKREK